MPSEVQAALAAGAVVVVEVADAVPAVVAGRSSYQWNAGFREPMTRSAMLRSHGDAHSHGADQAPTIGTGAPGSRRSARDPERVLERVHDQAGHPVRVNRAA
jgi:hypothetical protein